MIDLYLSLCHSILKLLYMCRTQPILVLLRNKSCDILAHSAHRTSSNPRKPRVKLS